MSAVDKGAVLGEHAQRLVGREAHADTLEDVERRLLQPVELLGAEWIGVGEGRAQRFDGLTFELCHGVTPSVGCAGATPLPRAAARRRPSAHS